MRVPVLTLAPEKHLEVPEGGWKENTLYSVKIAWSKFNPVYPSVFYSGFLSHGKPCGYSTLWSPYSHEQPNWGDLWYMEIVGVLDIDFNLT